MGGGSFKASATCEHWGNSIGDYGSEEPAQKFAEEGNNIRGAGRRGRDIAHNGRAALQGRPFQQMAALIFPKKAKFARGS